MNYRLVGKLLGFICLLIGVSMVFCLPWAFPVLGYHGESQVVPAEDLEFESRGFIALSISTLICFSISGLLLYTGRFAKGQIFLREAMAIVGLSWVMATVLGALPFIFTGVHRGCSVRTFPNTNIVYFSKFNWSFFNDWHSDEVTDQQKRILELLISPGPYTKRKVLGLTEEQIGEALGVQPVEARSILQEMLENENLAQVLLPPESTEFPNSPGRYRLRWIQMGIVDSLFESQSGFSTTGATVIGHLEDQLLIPHCILFWRSMTHFLGGLGIIVLFVVVLGEGSAGKALMRNEVPGPINSNPTTKMRHAAMIFTGVYCGLNAVLAATLMVSGMNPFDAITHSFATMATGGFSNYDSSLGQFESPFTQYIVILFMILAGTNFTLLYQFVIGKPLPMLRDVEWRTYVSIILIITALVVFFGMLKEDTGFKPIQDAIRVSLFQVVSIITTTGFGTADFDDWNNFGRGVLLLLMFVGGCAGSTGGGLKVIRHVLLVKILQLEVEKSYRPRLVKKIQLSGRPVDDPNLAKNILVYVSLIFLLFSAGWLYVVAFEPTETWGEESDTKLIDSASAVAATLNNIGPGLGTVGPTRNYGHFTNATKLVFVWLMMLGRLELYVVLVLFIPKFWRGYS